MNYFVTEKRSIGLNSKEYFLIDKDVELYNSVKKRIVKTGFVNDPQK